MIEDQLAGLQVPCPAHKFDNRKVIHCLSCEHFGEFVSKSDTDEINEKTAVIHCSMPITRRMIRVEV